MCLTRNKNHENTKLTFNLNVVTALATEYKLLTQQESNIVQTHRINVTWHNPHKGYYKLNLDGAFNKEE